MFKPETSGNVRFSTCGSQFHTYLNIYESVDDSDDDMYYYMMYMYSSSSHTCGSITEYPAGTNWQDAVDFCEETGMGLIASRDGWLVRVQLQHLEHGVVHVSEGGRYLRVGRTRPHVLDQRDRRAR